jgi:hypothetical protein
VPLAHLLDEEALTALEDLGSRSCAELVEVEARQGGL